MIRIATLLIGVLITAGLLIAAEPADYKLTEVERLNLELIKTKAEKAAAEKVAISSTCQTQFQKSSADEAQASADFRVKVDEIKKAHKWGDDVQFDPQTLTFSAAPAPKAGIKAPAPTK